MQRKDTDYETSLNREAAYGEDEPVRDDRNLVEKARDAVVGSPNRTRDDVAPVRVTNGVEDDAQGTPLRRADATRAQLAADSDTRLVEPPSNSARGMGPVVGAPTATGEPPAMPRDRGGVAADDSAQNLLPSDSLDRFQSRWQQIQIGFVDEPRTAVRDAEALVSDVVGELTAVFTRERENLEQRWDRGNAASTEDLRIALQRYRSFFQRLLAA